MSSEKLNTPTTTDYSLSQSIKWYRYWIFGLVLKGSCSKKKKEIYTPVNGIIVFIVYELDTTSRDLNTGFTLKDCFLVGVKIVKNADPYQFVFNGCGIRFNLRSELSLSDVSVGKNAIIFGIDMSSSVDIDDKKKDILILGICPTQGLDDTTLSAETRYSINF